MSLVSSKSIRVFIVEDYRLIRLGLKCDLEGIDGIEVIGEAEDAETGIECIKEHAPDVVLMDLGLPKMSGIEAIQVIKAINPGIKILVITSHDEAEMVTQALSAGANGYCMKDISAERLATIITDVQEGAAWLAPTIAAKALSQIGAGPAGMGKPSFPARQPGHQPLPIALTTRESTVLQLLAEGNNNNEIAEAMMVSIHTIKTHVCNIFQKLDVDDRVQAAVKALQKGLVSIHLD